MPQLDFSTFLHQGFWVLVFFFFSYIVLIKNFIPILLTGLKLRARTEFLFKAQAKNLSAVKKHLSLFPSALRN